ncbi:xanthine dehydrogenase accessory protein XdhC [Sulfitobacter albidus]|uniref:Xanthine dehydrogenase accessory protein XdhC n=1 Tax=Sulfitobacter albidus TaxID=2829501 RepID=A0A975JE75_9RHOB|nr:xanthine dehydrogenase accessory protein XdhC [Sulfitobacter albidus]QUJ76839.1 xanthine dehydrogenase accessory protein XdhC [Sulfitobacter albidus]
MSVIYVEITATRGSAPRDAGTVMAVTAEGTQGTIGGGALEYRAIAMAREMLADGVAAHEETVPLGPALGQCCGGSVWLRFGRDPRFVDLDQFLPPLPPMAPGAATAPLWIWGAGHVGRAVARLAAPHGAFDLTWIDTGEARFPVSQPQKITCLPCPDMPRLAHHAPQNAHHLIFTYSHEIDFALCAALLARPFASCGLIASATKKARFYKRLRAMGLDPARLTSPIGDPARGKHPDLIAHSTLTALLKNGVPADDSARDPRTAIA